MGDSRMKRAYSWPSTILLCVVLLSMCLVRDTRLWGQQDNVTLGSSESSEFTFVLELYGDKVADYNECLGLGSSNEVEETTDQTDAITVKRGVPGALEWHTITLRRTGPSGKEMWSWRKAMEDGNMEQAVRDGTIIMYRADTSEPVAQWDFRDGWVSRLIVNGATEELTIVHNGIERVDWQNVGSGGRGL
ncbi:MAG: phage tail protein [Phycisphaerae bacterium]|nr:phage tail protein [Phycisphaerae bacterium]